MKKTFFLLLFLVITLGSQAKPKYAIALFHYNFQYVAGDYRIEARIVRESLWPALQFLEKHPKYRVDLEFQGYAIETMAQEYPEVLKLLKKLIARGQVELVVAHYSDQFFIGYPALDLQRSVQLSDEVLKKHGMKRSRVFFGQEIQYSPGLASALKGMYDVVVTSSDPYSWYRGSTLPLVRVRYGGDEILGWMGGGEKELENLSWTWSFLDDGEVFNTLDYNSDFYRVPEQEKKSIDRFRQLEKEGYQFVTISTLVDILKKDKDYDIPDALFIPEGTWNMSVCGPFMWMGRQRSGVETDGITRALSYQLRGEVLTAEKLVEAFGEDLAPEVAEKVKGWLQEAWRHLLLSEVSDASGWTPWPVEVQYTANEVASARMVLKQLFDALKEKIPGGDECLHIDTRSGGVTKVKRSIPPAGEDDYLPLSLFVRAASYDAVVKKVGDHLWRLDITCARPADGAVEITFPTAEKGLFYSAGCGEETMTEVPADLKHDPALALSNGFLYLGNGYTLIKDCTVEHLAVTWRQKEQRAVFREELNENNPGMRMRFYIFEGKKADGHRLANRLNTWPVYEVWEEEGKVKVRRMMLEGL